MPNEPTINKFPKKNVNKNGANVLTVCYGRLVNNRVNKIKI